MHILGETKGVVNIECKSTFKKLALFSSGYVVRLKQAGRADTTHTEGKYRDHSGVQWSAVTVTPSGIGKSVTVTDCHSKSS